MRPPAEDTGLLRNFGAVVFVTRRRFTEIDIALIKAVHAQRIPFVLVRTHFNIDVGNHATNSGAPGGKVTPDVERAAALLLRREFANTMAKYAPGVGRQHLYLVSGLLRDEGKYDMPDLMQTLKRAAARLVRRRLQRVKRRGHGHRRGENGGDFFSRMAV